MYCTLTLILIVNNNIVLWYFNHLYTKSECNDGYLNTVISFCGCEGWHSFIHSIGMCRMRQFLAVLRNIFHFSLLYTLSFHPFPPMGLSSSLTSSCHLFLGLPLSLVASKFIYNTFWGVLLVFYSILCTCPNQRNLFNLIVYVIVGFLTIA